MTGLSIKEYVAQEKVRLKEELERLQGRKKILNRPVLNIVQVGDVEASNRYVRNKIKDAQEIGINAILHKLPETISTYELQECVNNLYGPTIVQLPLPKGVEEPSISPSRDVDGFGPTTKFVPCTPGGIIDYLDTIGFEYEGKLAVVIGRSDIVGKPMAKLLLDKNCTTAVVHSKTPETTKRYLLQAADLVVCAVGKAGVLDPKECPNAFIVDVGINFDENGKLVGDVLASAPERTTPVPGGVGLLTRLKLMKNTLDYYM